MEDTQGEEVMMDISTDQSQAANITLEGSSIQWNLFSSNPDFGIQAKTINLDVSQAEGEEQKMTHLTIFNWSKPDRSEDYLGYLWLSVDSQEIELFIMTDPVSGKRIKKTIGIKDQIQWENGTMLKDLRSCYNLQSGEVWF